MEEWEEDSGGNDRGGMRGKTVEEWEKIQWQSRREDSGGIMGGKTLEKWKRQRPEQNRNL